jgi:hypothetical protein
MQTNSVGQRISLPPPYPEGAVYQCYGDPGQGENGGDAYVHELMIFIPKPENTEVEAVKKGKASFALYTEGPLLVLLYEFAPGLPWGDAPFTWHLVPQSRRVLPPVSLSEGSEALLQTIFVDQKTGIIKALRVKSLSTNFTQALHQAIHAQAALPWTGGSSYDDELQRLYQRYPSTKLLLQDAQHREPSS